MKAGDLGQGREDVGGKSRSMPGLLTGADPFWRGRDSSRTPATMADCRGRCLRPPGSEPRPDRIELRLARHCADVHDEQPLPAVIRMTVAVDTARHRASSAQRVTRGACVGAAVWEASAASISVRTSARRSSTLMVTSRGLMPAPTRGSCGLGAGAGSPRGGDAGGDASCRVPRCTRGATTSRR